MSSSRRVIEMIQKFWIRTSDENGEVKVIIMISEDYQLVFSVRSVR